MVSARMSDSSVGSVSELTLGWGGGGDGGGQQVMVQATGSLPPTRKTQMAFLVQPQLNEPQMEDLSPLLPYN